MEFWETLHIEEYLRVETGLTAFWSDKFIIGQIKEVIHVRFYLYNARTDHNNSLKSIESFVLYLACKYRL